MEPQGLPREIVTAVQDNNVPTVQAWLDQGHDVNTFDSTGHALLHHAALRPFRRDVVVLLLARGADPDLQCTRGNNVNPLFLASVNAAILPTNREEEEAWLDIIDNLISHGARTDSCDLGGFSMLACVVGYSGASLSACLRLGIIGRLLRAGASLDNCVRGAPIEASIRQTELHGSGGRTPADVADDASFAAGKAFIAEFRAAGGTWKKWLRAPHRDVIRLRSLLVRKRATTSDPVLAFVFRLGDNGVFWTLLGFWPGRVLPPGVRY